MKIRGLEDRIKEEIVIKIAIITKEIMNSSQSLTSNNAKETQ